MAWQQYVCREIVASAIPNGGHVLYLGDTIEDGLLAVRQFGAWEKLRNRKSKGPQLDAIAYYNVRSVQDLAKSINSTFAEHDGQPRIVVRDVSRLLAPMMSDDPWIVWLPLLLRLAPAQYLTATHASIRGAAVAENKKPFTASWVLSDGHEPPPAERYGERWNLTQVPNGQTIKLQGQSYPGDLLFNLYEKPKEKVL